MGKKPGLESREESLQCLKMMKKVKHDAFRRSVHLANKKVGEPSFDEDNSSQPCPAGDTEQGPPNTAVTRLSPSDEHIGDREASLTNPSPMESSSEEMSFSISKLSEMPGLVETVLKTCPQQPHFRPLLEHGKELREGLVCGLMITYGRLLADLSKLRITDSEQVFKKKLGVLDYLERYGWKIQQVRDRLENLLEIHDLFGQLKGKKAEEDLLLRKLEERLERVKGDITDKKAHIQATEESIVSVKTQFDDLVTAPLPSGEEDNYHSPI